MNYEDPDEDPLTASPSSDAHAVMYQAPLISISLIQHQAGSGLLGGLCYCTVGTICDDHYCTTGTVQDLEEQKRTKYKIPCDDGTSRGRVLSPTGTLPAHGAQHKVAARDDEIMTGVP